MRFPGRRVSVFVEPLCPADLQLLLDTPRSSQWRFASLLHALWLFQRQRLGAIEGTRREIVRPVPRGLELGDVHELGTEGSNKQVLADGACSQPVILLLHHVHVLHVMQQPFAPSVDLVESRLHSSQQDCRLVLAQIPSPSPHQAPAESFQLVAYLSSPMLILSDVLISAMNLLGPHCLLYQISSYSENFSALVASSSEMCESCA
mmetsp:Transcript_36907/g.115550  ORF Transcript_36907/g.115550 Transcript_36907/m.115550 type:complete len:205 (+) Transcript_36907:3645-4259(+)